MLAQGISCTVSGSDRPTCPQASVFPFLPVFCPHPCSAQGFSALYWENHAKTEKIIIHFFFLFLYSVRVKTLLLPISQSAAQFEARRVKSQNYPREMDGNVARSTVNPRFNQRKSVENEPRGPEPWVLLSARRMVCLSFPGIALPCLWKL